MLSPTWYHAPLSSFASGLSWRCRPFATLIVNKDCLLCSPFPRWPEVRADGELSAVGGFLPFFFILFGKQSCLRLLLTLSHSTVGMNPRAQRRSVAGLTWN